MLIRTLVYAMVVLRGMSALAQCPLAFEPPVVYPTGGQVQGIAAGDFNGDGVQDLVTSGAVLTVFIGNGDGTYGAGSGYATPASTYTVAVGYLNGDDVLDIAAPMNSMAAVMVLLGQGDGTFAPAVGYPTGAQPVSVAIADLNGDAISDMVTAEIGSETVSVLLGVGDGSFQARVPYGGVHPFDVAIGDMDGDGAPDVVVSDATNHWVSVLLGNGDGTLGAPWHSEQVFFPLGIDVGDLSGDGIPDVAAAGLSNDEVAVLLGNGDGTLSAPVHYTLGSAAAPYDVAIGDLNNDGANDLAAAGVETNFVFVLLGEGNGAFQDAEPIDIGGHGTEIAMDDLNGDGGLDLAFASGVNAVVLLGQGVSIFVTQQPQNAFVEAGQNAVLSVTADNVVAYQWRKDGVPLVDDETYGGVATDTLTVTGAMMTQAGVYEVLMQAACNAGLMSRPAALCVDSGGPECPADFNGDGVIDTRDVLAFLNAWHAGC